MITIESLISSAQQRTGLTDFGDQSFLEPMQRFSDSVNKDAKLTERGEQGVSETHIRILVNRLRAHAAVSRSPELRNCSMLPPTFITGLPRTGTTALHRMLSSDDRFSFLPTWLTMNPLPIPGGGHGEEDPRISLGEAEEVRLRKFVPDVYAAHPFRAREAEEEIFILRMSYLSTALQTYTFVPTYAAWLETQDQSPTYRYLRLMLQLIQSQDLFPHATRWLLKSPMHMDQLPLLLREFPDARIIVCHRDPVDVMASWVNMITNLHRLSSDTFDPVAVGQYWTKRLIQMLNRFVATRDGLPGGRVLDISYREITDHKSELLDRIYRFIDLPLLHEKRTAILGWDGNNPQHRFGKHRYDINSLPLDGAAISREVVAYKKRFLPDTP